MKILFVGDPHVQPSNLEESERLLGFILDTAKKEQADSLVFAGDLFHTHAVVRMEVMSFWQRWLNKIEAEKISTALIVGNHDQIGDKQREDKMSALDPFSTGFQYVSVISKPRQICDLGFLPYTSDHEKFLAWTEYMKSSGVKRLFCHQTFDGSKYDNGFYAPDGIDVSRIPVFDEVVSGHIHTEQKVGSFIFYPGTPKWDTMSDANEEKGIWISDKAGSWKKIPTASVCRKITKITLEENSYSGDVEIKENEKTVIELVGSTSWISSMSKKLKGKASIIAKPTESEEKKKKRKNMNMDIYSYADQFAVKSSKEDVKAYLKEVMS